MSGTKIKICGLYAPRDADYVNEAMPDYAGFVFYPNSHRNVTEDAALALRRCINPAIETVGVFVDAPMDQMVRVYTKKIVSIIQLHGNEDNAYIEQLRKRLPEAVIWKAYKVRSSEDLKEAQTSTADLVLLDNGYGTGVCFDWSILESFPKNFILAGGLTVENIPLAMSKFHPLVVDISSGVETAGRKDKEKILAAVSAVKRS